MNHGSNLQPLLLPASIYMFKVNNRNRGKMCETYSVSTDVRSDVFIVNFD